MKKYLGQIVLSVCALGLLAARVDAAVPLTFTQQGRLLNTDGTAVAGPVRMIFAVYDSSSSTTPLWTETQSNVALDNGAFSVQLGAVTAFPTTLWTGATLYLGVTIGNDAEMTPREQITSVPYALLCGNADHATNADQLGGQPASSYALGSQLTTEPTTAPALLNDWVNYTTDSNPFGYFKDPFGIVHLRGIIKETSSAYKTIFQLPAGYRPLKSVIFPTTCNTSASVFYVGPDGTITTDGSCPATTFLLIEGATFRAEQ